MPLPILALLAGGGALFLFMGGASKSSFTHLPKPLADGIKQNLDSNQNAVQLRQLAGQLRLSAAQASTTGDTAAVLDYNRAADELDAKAGRIAGGTGDPVTQAAQILTQAGPSAAQIPGILSSVPAAQAAPPVPAPPIAIPPGIIPPTPTPPFVPPPFQAPVSIPVPAGIPPMVVQVPGFPGTPPQIPSFPAPVGPQVPGFPGTPPFAPPPAPSHYVVANGDFPYKIAARFGVSLGQLAGANPAHKTDIVNGKIFAGQQLALPANAHDTGPQTHASGHAV